MALLTMHRIEVLVDVRSQPYSKYVPQFNKRQIESVLAIQGIKYLFLGRELGGRPLAPEHYDSDGRVLFTRIAETQVFLDGMSRLKNGIEKYRVALMCSEEEPSECHRHLLLGRVLAKEGISVWHIRGDGSVQNEEDLARQEAARGLDYVQADLKLVAGVATIPPAWRRYF